MKNVGTLLSKNIKSHRTILNTKRPIVQMQAGCNLHTHYQLVTAGGRDERNEYALKKSGAHSLD